MELNASQTKMSWFGHREKITQAFWKGIRWVLDFRISNKKNWNISNQNLIILYSFVATNDVWKLNPEFVVNIWLLASIHS